MIFITLFLCLFFVSNVLNSSFVSDYVVGLTLSNCSETMNKIGTDYESMKARSEYKYKYVILTHYLNNQKINSYQLTNAHRGITTSNTFDRNLPVVIFIHGYLGDSVFVKYFQVVKKAMKTNILNANVFIVNAGVFLNEVYYYKTTINTRILGERIGVLLADLYMSGIKNFHLIGHSLGAHASGFAGKIFKQLTSVQLDRITGLDPAGPCYFVEPPELRLTDTDAKFVDVIHTNTDFFGIRKSIGHVDFYPNSGHIMTGCFESNCSHGKVCLYFSESVSRKNFLAVKCSDWDTFKNGGCSGNPRVVMGYWTPTNTPPGDYFLVTGAGIEYGLGENGIL